MKARADLIVDVMPTRSVDGALVYGQRATLPLLPEHEEAVHEAKAASQAQETSRTYRSQLKTFESWCATHGYNSSPPVNPAVVGAYLSDRRANNGASRSTLAVSLAAIKAGHRAAGQRFDDADPELQKVLAGNSRLAAREQKQARPLKPALLAQILAGLDPGCALDVRDGALLGLLYVAALRRSELAGLDLDQAGDGTGVLRITDEGLEVVLLRSKTQQTSQASIAILRDANPQVLAAIERWVKRAGIEPASPIFRRIAPMGTVAADRISGDGVCRAVKARMRKHYEAHGTDPATAQRLANAFSGHSGRVGLVVAAKEAGAADTDIAATSRHRSLEMIRRYGEQADQKRRAVHKLKGVGV